MALGPSQVYKENPLDTLFTSEKLKISWLQDPSRPFSPRKNLMLRMGAGFGTLFTQEKLKISRLQDPSRPFSPRESFMFLMGASFGTLFTPEKLQLLLATPASTPFSTTLDLHFFVPTLSWVPFRQGKARRSAYPCCLRHHETNKQNYIKLPTDSGADRGESPCESDRLSAISRASFGFPKGCGPWAFASLPGKSIRYSVHIRNI